MNAFRFLLLDLLYALSAAAVVPKFSNSRSLHAIDSLGSQTIRRSLGLTEHSTGSTIAPQVNSTAPNTVRNNVPGTQLQIELYNYNHELPSEQLLLLLVYAIEHCVDEMQIDSHQPDPKIMDADVVINDGENLFYFQKAPMARMIWKWSTLYYIILEIVELWKDSLYTNSQFRLYARGNVLVGMGHFGQLVDNKGGDPN